MVENLFIEIIPVFTTLLLRDEGTKNKDERPKCLYKTPINTHVTREGQMDMKLRKWQFDTDILLKNTDKYHPISPCLGISITKMAINWRSFKTA
jgi:hypothetical protein